MNSKVAAILFVVVCVVLSVLLLKQIISSLVGGIIFAIALILFGIVSKDKK